MNEADRRRLQDYLSRSEDDLLDELGLHDASTRGVADTWAKIAGPLHQRLCVEWNWCKVR